MKLLKDNWLNLLLAGIGLAPLLWLSGCDLWARPAYQFFPLAVVGASLLAWRAAREWSGPSTPGLRLVTWLLGGLAAAAFLAGNILWSPWLGLLALWLFLAAGIWNWGGRRGLGTFLPPLLMLASMVPPPLGWDLDLTLWLRSVAVNASSTFLDLLQVIHTLEGNTIVLPGKPLLVEEACSGINSVVLCGALCLFCALWHRRPPAWLLVLLPVTCAFVVLGNIIRITTGATLYYYWQIDWLSGRQHELFGVVLVLAYALLILSLDQLLFFFMPSGRTSSGGQAGGGNMVRRQPAEGHPAKAPSFALNHAGWLLALVGVGVFVARLSLGYGVTLAPVHTHGTPRNLELSLPAEVAGWRQLEGKPQYTLEEKLGVRSFVWCFARGGTEAVVAVDYPLHGFHNVKLCYLNTGWDVVSEEQTPLNRDGVTLPAFKLVMQRSVCQHAVVFHAVLNERGDWLLPPVKKNVLQERLSGLDKEAYETSYRIQVLTGAYMPIPEAAVADARELFLQSSQLLRQQLVSEISQTADQ